RIARQMIDRRIGRQRFQLAAVRGENRAANQTAHDAEAMAARERVERRIVAMHDHPRACSRAPGLVAEKVVREPCTMFRPGTAEAERRQRDKACGGRDSTYIS